MHVELFNQEHFKAKALMRTLLFVIANRFLRTNPEQIQEALDVRGSYYCIRGVLFSKNLLAMSRFESMRMSLSLFIMIS